MQDVLRVTFAGAMFTPGAVTAARSRSVRGLLEPIAIARMNRAMDYSEEVG
jgi:hypothetical protein